MGEWVGLGGARDCGLGICESWGSGLREVVRCRSCASCVVTRRSARSSISRGTHPTITTPTLLYKHMISSTIPLKVRLPSILTVAQTIPIQNI